MDFPRRMFFIVAASLAKDIHALKWNSQWVTGRFCFMWHYDIAYRGPDTRSEVYSISENKSESQDFVSIVCFRIVF